MIKFEIELTTVVTGLSQILTLTDTKVNDIFFLVPSELSGLFKI